MTPDRIRRDKQDGASRARQARQRTHQNLNSHAVCWPVLSRPLPGRRTGRTLQRHPILYSFIPGVAARPVRNLVSIGGSGPVWSRDAVRRSRSPRDQGPIGQPGTARSILALKHRELGKHPRTAPDGLILQLGRHGHRPLVTVADRCGPMGRARRGHSRTDRTTIWPGPPQRRPRLVFG